MAFIPRTSSPDYNNKYYQHTSCGGYNKCIKINGTQCLPNCVGYAYGRFMEAGKVTSCNLPTCNAEDWFNNSGSYSHGQVPKVGAVMCFSKGKTGTGSDGAGHVLIVEAVYSDGSILCSQSGYKSSRFWTSTYKSPYRLSGYNFQGFIYNPNVDGGSSKLNIDGVWGLQTTAKCQEWLGTTVDGIVSNQLNGDKKSLPACHSGSWQWGTLRKGGSPMIKKLQAIIGTTADGYFGANSVKALQKYLNGKGYDCGTADGVLGTKTAKAFQTYLNTL